MELCYVPSLLPRYLSMSSLTHPHSFPSATWVFHLSLHHHHHPDQGCAPTCVFPPASTSRLVVANVAELGKQEKREEMRLETPWAKSSWRDTVR